MEQQFDLMLENRRRAWWVFSFLPILLLADSWAISKLIEHLPFLSKQIRVWVAILAGTSVALALFFLLIRIASDAALITIEADKLTVFYRRSGLILRLPFTSIATHQLTSFRGAVALRITHKDGSTHVLRTSNYPARLLAMSKGFEMAFGHYIP